MGGGGGRGGGYYVAGEWVNPDAEFGEMKNSIITVEEGGL